MFRLHRFLDALVYRLLAHETSNRRAMPRLEFLRLTKTSEGALFVDVLMAFFAALTNSAGRLMTKPYACVGSVFAAAAVAADRERLDFTVFDAD